MKQVFQAEQLVVVAVVGGIAERWISGIGAAVALAAHLHAAAVAGERIGDTSVKMVAQIGWAERVVAVWTRCRSAHLPLAPQQPENVCIISTRQKCRCSL